MENNTPSVARSLQRDRRGIGLWNFGTEPFLANKNRRLNSLAARGCQQPLLALENQYAGSSSGSNPIACQENLYL